MVEKGGIFYYIIMLKFWFCAFGIKTVNPFKRKISGVSCPPWVLMPDKIKDFLRICME